MTFSEPAALLGLALVPLAALAYRWRQRRRGRFPVWFTNLRVLAPIAAKAPSWRRHVPAALLLAALAALLLGMARPHVEVRVPRRDGTVVLVMDVSGSMRAEDVAPTRIEAAQAAAREFVRGLPRPFRVGVVSFATTASVLVPPTTDRRLIARTIDSLEADGGTAMGDALVEAVSAIERGTRRADAPRRRADRAPAAIVLLSDGANTVGDVAPLEAAEIARRRRLPVYTIALGTDRGFVLVPGPGGIYGWQRVPPDPATLRAIASRTGGAFFEAPDDEDLRTIYDRIAAQVSFRTEQREVTAALAVAGFALLAAAGVLSTLRKPSLP